MKTAFTLMGFVSLVLNGALFGFFYAWICSTIWGLDAAAALVAVEAMQAMNASVRNVVFAPAFFGTPVALLVTALLALMSGQRRTASAFGLAGLICLFGGVVLTFAVNVPMNEALALQTPQNEAEAAAVWADYSPRWQRFNQLRTMACGISLILVGWGLHIKRHEAVQA
ncbi:MAG: anthrone oxygenase family protein [Pseudomonadota bacterium]